jgi:hypothetical protein
MPPSILRADLRTGPRGHAGGDETDFAAGARDNGRLIGELF